MPLKKTEYVVKYTTRNDPKTVRMETFTDRKKYDEFWQGVVKRGGKILIMTSHPYRR